MIDPDELQDQLEDLEPPRHGPRPPHLLGRPWTTREVAVLRRLARQGAEAVAAELGRSVLSVRRMANRQRISLRRAGVRSGRVMGQGELPEDPALRRAWERLRLDQLEGRTDVRRLEHRARLLARGAELCPSCAARPIEVDTTGLCIDCHWYRLAEAHGLERGTYEAKKALEAARQQKHRRQARAPFACTSCRGETSFETQAELDQHLKVVHPGWSRAFARHRGPRAARTGHPAQEAARAANGTDS